MPEMPAMARALAASPPYRILARRVVPPWILQGERPAGEGLEIGAGSGVMSAAMLHHVVAWESALAEAVRVLRSGGRLIGYDLLDTAPMWLMHFGDSHDTRMLRPGQLEAELAGLRVTNVWTRTALAGLVITFAATKG